MVSIYRAVVLPVIAGAVATVARQGGASTGVSVGKNIDHQPEGYLSHWSADNNVNEWDNNHQSNDFHVESDDFLTVNHPTISPTQTPTSAFPTASPTQFPTSAPPSEAPSQSPTSAAPSSSDAPTASPSQFPTSASPSAVPSQSPTSAAPSASVVPSQSPTVEPSFSQSPTAIPSAVPSNAPTVFPSAAPSRTPSAAPSRTPSASPSKTPTVAPSNVPSEAPTEVPTEEPTEQTNTNAVGKHGGSLTPAEQDGISAGAVIGGLLLLGGVGYLAYRQRVSDEKENNKVDLEAGDAPPNGGVTDKKDNNKVDLEAGDAPPNDGVTNKNEQESVQNKTGDDVRPSTDTWASLDEWAKYFNSSTPLTDPMTYLHQVVSTGIKSSDAPL